VRSDSHIDNPGYGYRHHHHDHRNDYDDDYHHIGFDIGGERFQQLCVSQLWLGRGIADLQHIRQCCQKGEEGYM
jgi:hypothetical protein